MSNVRNRRSLVAATASSMSTVPLKAVRHHRSCADNRAKFFSAGGGLPACRKGYYEPTSHRRSYVGVTFRGYSKEKCSKASWIAAQGPEVMCFVTWNIDGEDSEEEPDLNDIFFFNPFEEPQVAVSLQLGTKEVNMSDAFAASFTDYNEISVIFFLRKMLAHYPQKTRYETLQVAVYAFDNLFPGKVEANNIKIYELKKGEESMTSYPAEDVKGLLDDSRKLYQDVTSKLELVMASEQASP